MMRLLARGTYEVLRVLDRPVKTPRGKHPRGVALLIALITITLMSAAVVEFSYENRVNLALASNERDKLKSYFLAKSAINLSRLLLSFQFALHDEARQTEDDMGRLIGRAMRRSNFQMYQYVDLLMGPFNSGKIESPVGGINLQETGVEGFGDFTGEMEVRVVPEEGRVDVNQFSRQKLDENDLRQFCAMVLDTQYDDIFEQEDDKGVPLDRATVLQRIIDYVDPNEQGIVLGDACTVKGNTGDEQRPYDNMDDRDWGPRNRKLTHVAELNQVEGVTDAFMHAFEDQLTVYPVGKPNINVAGAPVYYSVLCQNVTLEQKGGEELTGIDLCSQSPQVAIQVMWFAMALEGVRTFFENPLSVLLAYVGSTESRLLPSAKKGQPVAYLSVSQLPDYIQDMKANPQLMAQFLQYSQLYQRMASVNPEMAIDSLNPQFPAWSIGFNKSGLMRSVTTSTPKIYRLYATGKYGSTKTTVEAIVDFGRTVRRLPSEKALEERESDPEALKDLKKQRREQLEQMPKGRYLYWREY